MTARAGTNRSVCVVCLYEESNAREIKIERGEIRGRGIVLTQGNAVGGETQGLCQLSVLPAVACTASHRQQCWSYIYSHSCKNKFEVPNDMELYVYAGIVGLCHGGEHHIMAMQRTLSHMNTRCMYNYFVLYHHSQSTTNCRGSLNLISRKHFIAVYESDKKSRSYDMTPRKSPLRGAEGGDYP